MHQVREVINTLEGGDADVALVDGNLSNRVTGEDGVEITRLLRAKFGESVVVIGVSGDHEIDGADHNVSKTDDTEARLLEIIAAL